MGRQQRYRLPVFFLVLGLLAGSAWADPPGQSDPVAAFLSRHWSFPLAPQGRRPPGFGPLEAELDPAACGACHIRQFRDWKASLHSRAMGPGVVGQLLEIAPGDREACLRCHAPLYEQAQSLAAAAAAAKPVNQPLYEQGLLCAGCHVRGYRRYGPPQREGSPPPSSRLPHGGWVSSAAFEDSRFCAVCHQFGDDGYALNGKFLENTYQEWQASPYGRARAQCQSCHMPDRRHLWRGIHDPAMVRRALTVTSSQVAAEGGRVAASFTVRNTGAGHFFPTYVTPRVIVEAYQIDSDGKALTGTLRRKIIAREVSLDLSQELFDTRLPPGGALRLDYRQPLHPRAVFLVFRVRVEPDHFYTGLYRSLLQESGTGKRASLIRQALKNSLASHFTAYAMRLPLSDPE